MSLIYKILSIFQSQEADFKELTPEIKELMEFRKELMSLQEIDRYIAHSDYIPLRENYSKTYTFFENAQRADTLDFYCKRNAIERSYVDKFLSEYNDVCLNETSSIISKHNEQYIQRQLNENKEYLDNILK